MRKRIHENYYVHMFIEHATVVLVHSSTKTSVYVYDLISLRGRYYCTYMYPPEINPMLQMHDVIECLHAPRRRRMIVLLYNYSATGKRARATDKKCSWVC